MGRYSFKNTHFVTWDKTKDNQNWSKVAKKRHNLSDLSCWISTYMIKKHDIDELLAMIDHPSSKNKNKISRQVPGNAIFFQCLTNSEVTMKYETSLLGSFKVEISKNNELQGQIKHY